MYKINAYQADVTNNVNNERRIYLGASETIFKDRYGNHVREGENKRNSNATELSK